MRWRYLILGVLCCIPVATAIQVWPPRPMFCIPIAAREYLIDDPTTRELLFMRFDKRTNDPPALERWSADTGHLNSETKLEWRAVQETNQLPNMQSAAYGFMMSRDRSTVAVELQGQRGATPDHLSLVAFFDSANGARRGSFNISDNHHFESFSPNGRWLARGHDDRVVVYNTQTGKTQCVFPSPPEAGSPVTGFFSPDSRQLLWQWGGQGENTHLFEVEHGQKLQSFSIPEHRTLCDWREHEVRTTEYTETANESLRKIFRHRFDGTSLSPGEHDPLLDCLNSNSGSLIQLPAADTDAWIARVDYVDAQAGEKGAWAKLLNLVQFKLGVNLNAFKRTDSFVRLIDRRSNAVLFEKKLPQYMWCKPALDGQILMELGSDATAFQIYRTDPWPRWVWTALGVACVMLPFVWFARRRHRVVMRRRAMA